MNNDKDFKQLQIDEQFSFVDPIILKNPTQLLKNFNTFIKNGGDVNIKDIDGRTILFTLASIYNHHETIIKYIKKHADINMVDKNGQTPMHFAVSRGHFKNIAVLSCCSADINVKDNNNNTPLDLLPEAKIDYSIVFSYGNINNIRLNSEIKLQYVPSNEKIYKVYDKILDFGESEVNWIINRQRESDIITKNYTSSHNESSIDDLGVVKKHDKEYLEKSETTKSIDNYKLQLAKYLLSWGASAKPETFDNIFEVKKRYLVGAKKKQREFIFSSESIKNTMNKLAEKRLDCLLDKLQEKGIEVEISEINKQLPLNDKLAFLAGIHFEKDMLTTKQLVINKNNTYTSREKRYNNIKLNLENVEYTNKKHEYTNKKQRYRKMKF